MGYIRHHAIVVTGSGNEIQQAHEKAKEIFEHLVSEIVNSEMNSYKSFFVAPDGSKEFWEESNIGDKNRAEFVKYLKIEDIAFCELFYGDEQGEAKIVNYI
jgi:hypothetical protein